MRISDWSSDVCSSDLLDGPPGRRRRAARGGAPRVPAGRGGHGERRGPAWLNRGGADADRDAVGRPGCPRRRVARRAVGDAGEAGRRAGGAGAGRSEEHTSELQSLLRISYAVICLITKTHTTN